ncbi:hypothetical protein IQ230_22980 [Gloeocapsopsis crepidinum LEGE 06123]|uniref:Transposase n=1 Tax=Gloeocapsopsis crepidinum LEGE 06123 TaxID=588587 RepID=A0ABR9UYU4_9CHRO|nr:hypothetical protein [Gloeocapsopsis crepidinum LEGE 06123]
MELPSTQISDRSARHTHNLASYIAQIFSGYELSALSSATNSAIPTTFIKKFDTIASRQKCQNSKEVIHS